MRSSSRAFTLIEMLMVMVIIAIIASLVVGVAGYANKKSAAQRTLGEIKAIETACESYKTDNGSVPRQVDITEQKTDEQPPIDPRLNGDPTSKYYREASRFLYQQLSGDADLDGKAGDTGFKVYFEFKPGMLSMNQAKTQVDYLQDPYGNSYGYSTAAARAEEQYRQSAKRSTAKDVSTKGIERGAQTYGYNSTFDLWSTVGLTTDPPTDDVRGRWVKNW